MKPSSQEPAPDTITLANSNAIHRAAVNLLLREAPSIPVLPPLVLTTTTSPESRALQHQRLQMIIKSALALLEQDSDDFDNKDSDYHGDEDNHQGGGGNHYSSKQ
jgi:hypothetical protein